MRAHDTAQQRVANMRRRAAMLARHDAARGEDGKSRLAVAAGRRGGQRTAEKMGPPRAWAVHMNLKRHHGVPLPWETKP